MERTEGNVQRESVPAWSSSAEIKDHFSVLLRGKRLEIDAMVDADGIARLQPVLEKYKEISKLPQ